MSTKPSVLLQSVEELERVFNRFDANGDGKICAGELDGVLRALGSETSQEELKHMMAEIDADGDGFIDLKEFVEFHRRSDGEDQDEMKELRCAFDLYDKDRDGLISATELHMVLKSLGEGCTVHDCGRMISSFDSDGDGNVNFEEFKKMMTVSRGASSE